MAINDSEKSTAEQAQAQEDIYQKIVGNIEKSKEQHEILKAQLETVREMADLQEAEFKMQQDRFNLQGSLAQRLHEQLSLTTDIVAQQKMVEEYLAASQSELADITAANKEILSLNREELDQIAKKQAELQDEKTTTERRKELLQEIAKLTEKAKGTQLAAAKLQREMTSEVSRTAGKLGLSAKYSDTTFGKFEGMYAQAAKLGGKGGLGNVTQMLGKSVGQTFNLKNVMAMVFEEVVKIGVGLDNASKKLGAKTGFGNVFSKQLLMIQKSGNMAGIGVEQAASAIGALADNVSSFNPKADRTNAYMGLTVARLEKLGVAAGSSAKTMDFMQRTMGLTGEQAADLTAQIARMGKEIGISGTKAINDFNAASGRLAIYGKNNVREFKNLAAAAKASGIEMQTLLNISSKFDKFDTAADSIAQMNAVLGTQLSVTEMLNASDADRILMMKQQIQAQVGNFNSLDKFTKMQIAQSMGVKDVAEAQKLLNMSMSEYEQYQKGQKEQADIQQEMADATEQLMPVMEQLKLALTQVALAFAPVAMVIADVLKTITPFIAGFIKFVAAAAPVIAVVGGIAAGVLGLINPFTAAIAVIMGLVSAFNSLWDIGHKPGSFSMVDGMFDKDIGASIGRLGKDAAGTQKDISNLSAEMEGMHDSVHKGGDVLDIQAMASLDTTKIADGFAKIKSILMDLSKVEMDGFIALRTEGGSTSMVMGSDGLIKKISEGKLTVDVKMPEFNMPKIDVKVFIGNTELRDIIRTEAKAAVGGAG